MKPQTRIRIRYILFGVIVLCVFGLLLRGLMDLQVTGETDYQSSASSQSIKTIALRGSRGMITDADSVILAMSEDVYNVTFLRDTSQTNYADFTASITQTIEIIERNGGQLCVSFVIGRDAETGAWAFQFGEGISDSARNTRESQWRSNHYLTNKTTYPDAASCYNRLVKRYLIPDGTDEALTLKIMAVYSEMQMNIFNSVPIVIAQDVDFATVSEIEGRSMMLTGMSVEIGEKRVYPRGSLASQIIGYIGPITSYNTYYDELKGQGYALTDTVGKDGIEKSQESWLTANVSSRQGYRVMEKDSVGALTRELEYVEPTDGNNVKLTILAAFQQQAELAVENNVRETRTKQEKKVVDSDWLEKNKQKLEVRDFTEFPLQLAETGCMMVLEADTGRVLAMAQYPTYDLNGYVAGGDYTAQVLLDTRNPLMNYAIQSRAEPGSIFKMVTGLAALVNGELTVDETISDGGRFMAYTSNEKEAPTCWIDQNYVSQHANQTIVTGLAHSCNYFFYTLGQRLFDNGEGRLYKYAASMGLTSKTGVELPGEMTSIVGNQATLYDPTVSLTEQLTSMPTLVAARLKQHLQNVGTSYGITYSTDRLDKCVKRLMDMALVTDQGANGAGWVAAMRPILMEELNMTRNMVYQNAVMQDLFTYLNEIRWGGSLEIQMAIGQSITLLTPAAVSRYLAAIANGGTVYNLSIIDSIVSPDGEILSQRQPSVFGELDTAKQYMPYILEGMEGVVDDDSGTAKKYFSNWKYTSEIRAKTGTSQVTIGKVKLDLENNAWFCVMAPFDDPQIAVVIHIPHGFSGSYCYVAAQEFLSWWMEEQSKGEGTSVIMPGNSLMP